ERGVLREPAASQSERAVGIAHLTHEQMQAAILGQRRDGVLAMRLKLGVVAGTARADLYDVSGRPGSRLATAGSQLDVIASVVIVAGIEQPAVVNPPSLVRGRLPVLFDRPARDEAELVLPVAQR